MLKAMLIGYGYWGPNLARALGSVPGLELVAVSDALEANRERARTAYPHLKTPADYNEGLDWVDAVLVATPPATHYAIASACISRGRHVYIEKPITPGIPEAQLLHREAEAAGVTLMVGHIYQYSPAVDAMADVLSSGRLGRILHYESVRANMGRFSTGANVVWDLLPHDLSILNRIGAPDVVGVSCHCTANMTPGVADVAHTTLQLAGGTRCQVTDSWYDPQRRRRFAVVGTEASLVLDEGGPARVTLYKKGARFIDGGFTYFDDGEEDIPFDGGEALVLECRHFADCIRGSVRPRTDALGAIGILRVIEAVQRSGTGNGEWVRVPQLDIEVPAS